MNKAYSDDSLKACSKPGAFICSLQPTRKFCGGAARSNRKPGYDAVTNAHHHRRQERSVLKTEPP